jgi:hypothetical protein
MSSARLIISRAGFNILLYNKSSAHDNCNASWCGYMENPNTYKHSGFPGGCDLSDQLLRKDLERVFNRVADKSDKLAHYGSSQAKESLNFI